MGTTATQAITTEGPFHVFGIRHHGPGSARSLERALAELDPDLVLIEGPPDADAILPLAADEDMEPPVAILVSAASDPSEASFYPFASFSPEWRALRLALARAIPVRFMDLPLQFRMALRIDEKAEAEKARAEDPDDESAPADAPEERADDLQRDPLADLAEISGYSDAETWWDAMVEGRLDDDAAVFAAVHEAMATLRACAAEEEALLERRREAFMRRTMRAAKKDGFERIAVVCGAWHVPALIGKGLPTVKHDNELLKGLRKVKVEATWTPWTYENLARQSGYRAGVVSPAWYEQLASGDPEVPTRWMIAVARLMRENDLDTSSAHVIEAVRLARDLAALRGRALPGLLELDEAVQAVICAGDTAPMELVRRQLVIGERLGRVPADAPAPPIQRDLEAHQKRLRMPAAAGSKELKLDLRKPLHLERSQLLHRLRMLGIPWGETSEEARRSKGTFAERWELRWAPEFVVRLIEVSRLGNTVAAAAANHATLEAKGTSDLGELAALLSNVLLADLPEAVSAVAAALETRAASGNDVGALMDALSPLVRTARYGSVRETDEGLLDEILQSITVRIVIGLETACQSLNAEAASAMLERVMHTEADLVTLADPDRLAAWRDALLRVADHEQAAPLLSGRAHRILSDAKLIESAEIARRMQRVLSSGVPAPDAAAWIEGFLQNSGLVLVHDAELLVLVDRWLSSLSDERFQEVLPLLRRTFSTFERAERRNIGTQAMRVRRASAASSVSPGEGGGDAEGAVAFDAARAARVLPVLRTIMRGPEDGV